MCVFYFLSVIQSLNDLKFVCEWCELCNNDIFLGNNYVDSNAFSSVVALNNNNNKNKIWLIATLKIERFAKMYAAQLTKRHMNEKHNTLNIQNENSLWHYLCSHIIHVVFLFILSADVCDSIAASPFYFSALHCLLFVHR